MDKRLAYVVIIITSITTFFVAYISSAISIVLPTMAVFFKMDNVMQNWISLIYLLVIATFSILAGTFSKRHGLKKSLLIGVVIFLLGSILSGISTSSLFIIASRAIEGLGAAFIYVSGTAMIVEAVDESLRGTALGINLASFYVGLTIAPFLGGFLSNNYGWQSIFYIQVPFLLIAIFLIIFEIKQDWVRDKSTSVNFKSLTLISIAIFVMMYGFTILNQIEGIALIIIGLVCFYLSFKQKNPVFKLDLFKNIKFLSSNIASLTSYIGIYVLTYVLNYHFQYIMGYSAEMSGALLVIGPLVMTFSAVIAGRLSDKRNPEVIAMAGIFIVLISMIMITLIFKNTPLDYIILAMVIYGVGYGLFASPNTKVIMSSLPSKYNDYASSAVSTSKYVGKTLSLALFTVIFAIVMGNVVISSTNYGLLILSSQITCGICTVFCFISFVATVVGYRSKN
ncbi:MAG: MFS transporter [Methanobrevibacter sp.]|uniref:MFS transporter n=1 Tax=Methanobrevibacter sp. TaxID=66852 RepID=UPI0026DF214D|nr:MFS transporter [Methanobrevibacter sp.]MDO5848822.1 MFS transporter [Methanobrevibacter sp.]